MSLYRIKVTLFFFLIACSSAVCQSLDFQRLETAVYFDFDSSQLTEEAQAVISNMFPYDSNFYPEYISITGHADKSGNKEYNKILSAKRANSVREFIAKNHISNTEFRLESVGEEQPAFSCDNTLNRCVKILMVLKEKEEPASLSRCKELFPEEFTTQLNDDMLLAMNSESPEVVNEKIQLPETILDKPQSTEKVELPSSLASPTTDDTNKFHRKVVTKSTDSLRLNDILFYGNSARYYDSAEPELEELAEFLLANENYLIAISGHVNVKRKNDRQLRKVSDFEDAYDLSLARADAVKKFLVEKGVSSKRISVEGKGGEEPVFKRPKTNAENAANRRIEIVFIKI